MTALSSSWAIPTRRTNRHLYTTQSVLDIVVKRLETIARAEGATLYVVQGADRWHSRDPKTTCRPGLAW